MDYQKIQRRVSIAKQDSLPEEHQLRIHAEVFESTITESDTARIRITTTNTGPKRALSVGTDGCDILNRGRGGSTPEGLWLYRPEVTDSFDRKDAKWVPDRPADERRAFTMYGCPPTVYETGDSIHNDYEVWHDYQVPGYLDPNTYRWEEDIRIWENPSATYTDSADSTVTWGFSLAVDNPC